MGTLIVIVIAIVVLALLSKPAPSVLDYGVVKVDYQKLIKDFGGNAKRYSTSEIPDTFLLAIIAFESGGKLTARGRAGEYGIFQLMAYHLEGVKERDRYAVNVQFDKATAFLASLVRSLKARGQFSLQNLYAAYNGGLGNFKTPICQARARAVLKHAAKISELVPPV